MIELHHWDMKRREITSMEGMDPAASVRYCYSILNELYQRKPTQPPGAKCQVLQLLVASCELISGPGTYPEGKVATRHVRQD
jgi:hypothetical protein